MSNNVDKITFDVTLDAVEIAVQGSNDVIKFEGSTPNSEVGAPALPVIRRAFAVPQCESVEIEVKAGAETVVPDVNLAVVPELVGIDKKRDVALSAKYEGGVQYPQGNGRIAELGSMRGQKIAVVELYPVHYDASSHEAHVASKLSVTLRPVQPRGPIFVNGGPMKNVIDVVLTNSPGYGKAVNIRDPRRTGGPGHVNWCTGTSISDVADSVAVCGADYLIIAAEELATPPSSHALIDSLAQRRADYNGFNVVIVTMADIDASVDTNDTPPKVRELIKDVYESESAVHMGDGRLGYVLLIGDARNPNGDWLIPGYREFVDHNSKNSDAAYELLDTSDPEDDLFPDLLLGRLPVDADAGNWELTNVRNKIRDYEPMPVSAAWVDKTVWISGGSTIGFEDGTPPNPFDDIFDEFEADVMPPSIAVRQMHVIDSGSNDPFSDAAVDTLESGARTAMLFDHGFYTYLAGIGGGRAFQPEDYDHLDGPGHPLVFAMGSDLGALDNDSHACVSSANLDPCDVLCERLVLESNGAIGSIGFCQSTGTDIAPEDARHLLGATYQYLEPDLGSIITTAKVLAVVFKGTPRGLTLFGDPALNIQWRDISHDNIDLAVTPIDIAGEQSGGTFPLSGSLDLTIHNYGFGGASAFDVEVWDGDPDDSGTLIDSVPFAGLAGYADSLVEVSYTLTRGRHVIHVVVDPDSTFNEARWDNNRTSFVLDFVDEEPGFPLPLSGGITMRSLVIADVAASAGKEILAHLNSKTCCVPASGTSPLWVRNQEGLAGGSLVVGSMDMDGHPNVVIQGAVGSGPYTVLAYMLNGSTGAVVDSFSVGNDFGVRVTNSGAGAQSYWIADLVPGDGLDMVVANGGGIEAFDRDGDLLWQRNVSTLTNGECSVALGDIDLDGDVEIAVARKDSVVVFNGANGQSVWRRQIVDNSGIAGAAFPRVCLVDLDSNGSLEVVTTGVASGQSRVYTWSNTGTQLHSASLGGFVFSGGTSLVAADVNGVAGVEIVAQTDTTLTVLEPDLDIIDSYHTESGTHLSGTVLLADYDNDGDSEIFGFSVHREMFNTVPVYTVELLTFSHTLDVQERLVVARKVATTLPQIAYPAIDDIDGDGTLELAIVVDSTLHVVEVGTTAGRVAWGMNHGDAMANRITEQPIRGTYSKPLSLFNKVRVLDDATFGDDLFIDGSADVVVNATPLTSGGNNKCDLTVQDLLKVQGWTTRNASLASSSGSVSSWQGFTIASDTDLATMKRFTLRDAQTGVSTVRKLTVSTATFTNCDVAFVAGDDTTTIDHTTFTDNTVGASLTDDFLKLRQCVASSNSFSDVLVGSNADAQVDTCQFSDSPVGIYCFGSVTAKRCTFDDAPVGVSFASGALGGTVKYSTFSDCPIGVQSSSLNSSALVTVRNNTIDNSTTAAVKVVGTNGTVKLRNNVITGSAVGVLADGSDAEVRFGNNINDNTIGVKCINSAYAVVESTQVVSNTTGVEVSSNSNADIGHATGGSSTGINSIHSSTPYNVKNLNTGITVSAENNWFGDDPPRNTGFSGSVDRNPWLTEDPELFFLFKPVLPTPKLPDTFALHNAMPNPFNPETTIPYDVPAGGGQVTINVYDVQGRRVATLMNERSAPGRHMVRWQGRDSRGAGVASGIYFVQMKAPGLVTTKKIVLLK